MYPVHEPLFLPTLHVVLIILHVLVQLSCLCLYSSGHGLRPGDEQPGIRGYGGDH